MMIHKIKDTKNMINNVNIYKNNRINYNIDYIANTNQNFTDFFRNQTYNDLLYLFNKEFDSINYQPLTESYKNKIKIVIYAPPIDYNCGGIMVLYNLAKTINSLRYPNIEALIYSYDHKFYANNFCNNYFNPLYMDDKTIVIYPETIKGNPLNAKNVVRWILLDLGLEVQSDFYKNWDRTDLVYHWEPTKLKYTKQLVNIWINPLIKKINSIENRIDTCFALKKLINLPTTLHKNKSINIMHDESCISIDNLELNSIIEIFNKSKRFYCYDPNTFYSVMAPLCGCITILHPFADMDKTNYFKSRILGHSDGFIFDSGIAYGDDPKEIERAQNTLKYANDNFLKLNNLYQKTVYNFLEDMSNLINDINDNIYNTIHSIYLK